MSKPLFLTGCLLVLLVLVLPFVQLNTVSAATPPANMIGLATRFSSSEHTTTMYQNIKNKMVQYSLNVIRIGSSDMFNPNNPTFPWNNGDAVDWFLTNTNFYVVIDRHHTINVLSLTSSQITTIENDMVADAQRWASYSNRVIIEAVNEYGGNDFYSVMQPILTHFRSHDLTNWLVFDRMGYSASNPAGDASWGYTWQTLYDPLSKTYQGGHYYMGHPGSAGSNVGVPYASDIGTRCYNGMVRGNSIVQQPMFGTENGGDWEESNSQVEVAQLTIYFQKCSESGFSNVLWMNHGLSNMAAYESLGLTFPTGSSPPPPPPPPPHENETEPLAIQVFASANAVLVNRSVVLTASASGGVLPYSYVWKTNGQVIGSSSSITRYFASEGTYTFTCTVTDGNYTSVTSQNTRITVTSEEQPPSPPPPPPSPPPTYSDIIIIGAVGAVAVLLITKHKGKRNRKED